VAEADPAPRIVVVDDEEGLLFLMLDALRRDGLKAEGFDSGDAALQWIARHGADLLLLDLNLSGHPATVLVQRLRERGLEIPFLVITGHGDERIAVEVMKQGALDYVMKESGVLELLPGIVRRALGVIERERKLAEAGEAVRVREEQLRNVIQTALDGFARFDREGRFLEVNRALAELLRYPPGELIGMSLFDLDAAHLPEEIRERIRSMGETGCEHCLTRLRRSDGAEIEVELSARADREHFFAFIHDISEQRRLEREVLQVSYDERSQIGRELHDGLGQQLTAIELMSSTLARELKSARPALATSARQIAEYTRNAITQTRRLAHGLAPVTLESEGLMVALNDLARMTTTAGVACEFECDPPVQVTDPSAAIHLFRIAQEAVNNALKHSKASRIAMKLARRDGMLVLTIEDDGLGLPENAKEEPGMGLKVIQHRARLIGGRLHVHSTPSHGVRIVCSLPVPHEAKA